jgi:hypothetical protein
MVVVIVFGAIGAGHILTRGESGMAIVADIPFQGVTLFFITPKSWGFHDILDEEG